MHVTLRGEAGDVASDAVAVDGIESAIDVEGAESEEDFGRGIRACGRPVVSGEETDHELGAAGGICGVRG